MKLYGKIIGTGSFIPPVVVKNEDFMQNEFFETYGKKLNKPNEEIIRKFYEITGIKERRYVPDSLKNSDIAYIAAQKAIEDAGIDPETIDLIIVGHNYGDLSAGDRHTDEVPSLASRVKHKLGIKNPWAVGFDLLYGCPGWIQSMITANLYLTSGQAKRALVIGSETLSRISDPHDRDAMIYADGAGAIVLDAVESEEPTGIISWLSRTDTQDEVNYLYNGKSFNPEYKGDNFFIKMYGRKVYEYALTAVPDLVKKTIDKAGISLKDIKKILIHQANEKMDFAIGERLFKLYGEKNMPADIMPMTIGWLGNSSVGTIPTMLDLILKGKLNGHKIETGDYVVFASVGAGMNINAFVYKF